MKKVLLLSGDGIGPEIMAQAEKVLHILNNKTDLNMQLETANIGGIAIDKDGDPYPERTRVLASKADAVLLASVGGPKWDNNERHLRPEQGLLKIRADLGLFANLRPAQVMDALVDYSSLKKELVMGLDLLIVRELTGGIYFGQPRGVRIDNGVRVGFNTMHYDENEIRRIAVVGFETAQKRQRRLCSVDKMNVLECSQLWRDVVNEVAKDYPEVELSHMLVDNAAMQLIKNPSMFDVILTSNLFGDILSDEASMLTGSIGLLPSASLREDRVGLYEPIHGSAPNIAGKDIANPLAMILSVGMMLRYSFGELQIADAIEQAVKEVINAGLRTADLIGNGSNYLGTNEMGDAICEKLKKLVN